MKKLKNLLVDFLPAIILAAVALLCAAFIIAGKTAEDGSRTLDGKNAEISESTTQWIESQREALARIMNETPPTDAVTIEEFQNGTGQGSSTTLEQVKSRRLPDGDNDNGLGWQCSKYTAYLATGRREYSTVHTDYGPVNGKDVVAWLVKNYGWKYTDEPVEGAIGSGGFNTTYGHTAEFLYWTGTNTAMVSDANFVPLTVATHNLDVSGWVWAVPGDYNPEPSPTPAPTPQPDEVTYSYVPGDTFGEVLIKLGLDEGNLWGPTGTVRYYTKQLIEEAVLTERGYVKLYTPFTLKRRGAQ